MSNKYKCQVMLSLSITKIVLASFSKRFYNTNTVLQSKMDKLKMMDCIRTCIPPLDGTNHKGQAGRIGIIGGSLEYTGAPYFAAISAMKVGADLVHVFCAKSAATVIKSYSPELIVHPLLDEPDSLNEIGVWLDRLHTIVIGPGLGRDPAILATVAEIIGMIRKRNIPLVIDADGLFLLNKSSELIMGFNSPVILTPNKIEFERLSSTMHIPSCLCTFGKNLMILKKGIIDEVFNMDADVLWKSNTGGSGRRCGGQGDILSGSIAIFLHWTLSNCHQVDCCKIDKPLYATSIACYAGSCLVRRCNEKAFAAKGRGMLASDMIEYIHQAFEELFGQ